MFPQLVGCRFDSLSVRPCRCVLASWWQSDGPVALVYGRTPRGGCSSSFPPSWWVQCSYTLSFALHIFCVQHTVHHNENKQPTFWVLLTTDHQLCSDFIVLCSSAVCLCSSLTATSCLLQASFLGCFCNTRHSPASALVSRGLGCVCSSAVNTVSPLPMICSVRVCILLHCLIENGVTVDELRQLFNVGRMYDYVETN